MLVFSLVSTLLGRLWYLQVLAAPQLRIQAEQNHIRDVVTAAPRGLILDDTGKPLVDNKPALVVSVSRTTLDRLPADQENAVFERLSQRLGIPYERLYNETKPCTYTTTKNKRGQTIVTSTPTPCNNGVAYQPVVVSQLKPTIASAKQALLIKEEPEDYPGVSVDLAAVRHYPKPDGALASAMLGYISKITSEQLAKLSSEQQDIERNAYVGATGLEAEYEQYLRGEPGVKQVAVNHVEAVTGTLKNTAPVPGDDVVTNIDAGVQAALENQLQAAIDTARHSGYTADYSAGVVLNARNGGIVAMASDPTYPPGAFVPQISSKLYERLLHAEGDPLLDKAFQSASPPGSTFKLISSSGLIHDGMLSPGAYYDCPTSYLGKTNFEGEAGLGAIPLRTALIVSCDTFFYELANRDWNRDAQLVKDHKAPVEGVQHIARDYGLGTAPEIDLPSAEVATGHIADRSNTKTNWAANKKDYCEGAARRPKGSYLQVLDNNYCKYGYIFFPGDQQNEDIGQGTVTASPLQLAVAYAAMANGGTVFEPRIAKAIVSPTGKLIKRIKAPVRDHLPLSQADLAYLRDAFIGVTTSTNPPGTAVGTFAGFPMSQVTVGGKTGTAELSGTSQNGCWFVAFAGPAGEKPQYVIAIEVNKANQGAVSAAPVARNMLDQIYGFGGHKALFPNGVPPHKLPKIQIVEAGPRPHHTPTTGATSGSTPSPGSTGTASSPSTTSALGPPPVLAPDRRRSIR